MAIIGKMTEEQIEALTGRALAGDSAAGLLAALAAAGVDPSAAWPEVAALLRSPILAGARAVGARGAAAERAARLHLAVDDGRLAERTTLDDDALHREHWTPLRPVVLRGAAAGWPALGWTFEALRDRFRWAPVLAMWAMAAGQWALYRPARPLEPVELMIPAALLAIVSAAMCYINPRITQIPSGERTNER